MGKHTRKKHNPAQPTTTSQSTCTTTSSDTTTNAVKKLIEDLIKELSLASIRPKNITDLLKKIPDLNASNANGITPLIAAIKNPNCPFSIIKKIIDSNKVDLTITSLCPGNKSSKVTWTYLIWATSCIRPDVLEYLLQQLATTEAPLAILEFHSSYVENNTTYRGPTALDIAKYRKHNPSETLLEKYGAKTSCPLSVNMKSQVPSSTNQKATETPTEQLYSLLLGDASSASPLLISCQQIWQQYLQKIYSLLQQGADPLGIIVVAKTAHTKITLLHGLIAASHNCPSTTDNIIKLLNFIFSQLTSLNQNKKLNLEVTLEQMGAPLTFAIASNQPQLVKLILQWGANPNTIHIADKKSALIRATCQLNLEILVLLLQHGADVNATNSDGDFAIMYAISSECKEVIQTILKYPNVNINIKNKEGITPVFAAIDANSLPALEMLFAYADKYKIKLEINTPIKKALEVSGNAKGNIPQYSYQITELIYPFDLALAKDNIEMIKLLIARGADVNCPGKKIHPLALALGFPKTFRFLIENNIYPDYINFRFDVNTWFQESFNGSITTEALTLTDLIKFLESDDLNEIIENASKTTSTDATDTTATTTVKTPAQNKTSQLKQITKNTCITTTTSTTLETSKDSSTTCTSRTNDPVIDEKSSSYAFLISIGWTKEKVSQTIAENRAKNAARRQQQRHPKPEPSPITQKNIWSENQPITWLDGAFSSANPDIRLIENCDFPLYVHKNFSHLARTQNLDMTTQKLFEATNFRLGTDITELQAPVNSFKICLKFGEKTYTLPLSHELRIAEEKRLFAVTIPGESGAPSMLHFCLYGNALHEQSATKSLEEKAKNTNNNPLVISPSTLNTTSLSSQ